MRFFRENRKTVYTKRQESRLERVKKKVEEKNIFLERAMKVFGSILLVLFCATVLALSIRGIAGNPTPADLNTMTWKDNGPLELSPERGRYALLYSLAENHSFSFSADIARFAAPDVAYTNGSYVSLFAPAVSFLAYPGYIIGKYFNLAQVGSFAVISLFAIMNVLLLRAIAIRLGAHPVAATLAALAFLFGTPAFAYAVTLYQHHISTFLILSSLYLLIRYNNLLSLFAIWALCAASIPVDYPNFFLMLPIGVMALARTIVVKKLGQVVQLRVPLLRVLTITGVVLPVAFFLWFNAASYGNPFQLSGTLERAIQVKANGTPVLERQIILQQLQETGQKTLPNKSALGFFQNRNLMNGFYEHLISPDRGMLFFTPVMLLGIFGMIIAVRKKQKFAPVLIGIIGFDLLLYSLWDDPYGGWAFGSRYMIPAYAMLSIFIATALTEFRKFNIFLLLFFATLTYSIGVNTLGAITSSRNPPKVEAVALEQSSHLPQPYTFERNMQVLDKGVSKSYVYQTFASNYISAWDYYTDLTLFIVIVSAFLIVYFRFTTRRGYYEV